MSNAATMTPPALEVVALEKTYPNGVRAVRGVTLGIATGEIHSIVGENGAGKSTLMKIAYGLEMATSGDIRVGGQVVSIGSPKDAIGHGIGMVQQHFMLVPSFTIAENVVLGAEPGSRLRVDRAAAILRTERLAAETGLDVDPRALAGDASVGQRQRAEILKAIGRGARVLILDEPTAVLTPQESDDLFAAVKRLRSTGLTVVFISHKLDEVRAVSDRISVLRQGALVGTYDVADTTEASLASSMVGRDVSLNVVRSPPGRRDVVLAVQDLTAVGVGPVSFEVRTGEVVGIAGIEDSGQNVIIRVVAGLEPATGGQVTLSGRDLSGLDVGRRRSSGIAHVPEDRLANGAALDLSIEDNLVVDRHGSPPLAQHGLLRRGRVRDLANRLIQDFSIRTPDARVAVGSLSGGNLQKVVVARELSSEPELILAAHPTRGVDIGAMEFMYARIAAARDKGTAVLLISADLTELLALSDRLLVIREGRLVGRFDDASSLTEEVVGRFMLGLEEHG